MDYDAAVAWVRSRLGLPVVVVLEPDHSVMPGVLHEIDSSGMDAVAFAVGDPARPDVTPTGMAAVLFRDAFETAAVSSDGALHVRQGRVEVIVAPATEAPPPDR